MGEMATCALLQEFAGRNDVRIVGPVETSVAWTTGSVVSGTVSS